MFRHKLMQIGINDREAEAGKSTYASDGKDFDLDTLAWCIQRHNDAIE